MSGDRRRPDQQASASDGPARDRALRTWVTDTVHPHGDAARALLDRSGLGRRGLRGTGDLRRLPVTPVSDLGDGRDWVLEPTAASLALVGPITDRLRARVADALGRRPELDRERVEAVHRPVVWTASATPEGPLFVASTATDLDRLAAIGRRALPLSGIGRDDRLVLLGEPSSTVAGLQLVVACRDAGVAHLYAGPSPGAVLTSAAPTVVAGSRADLDRAAAAGLPDSVRALVELSGGPGAPPGPSTAGPAVAQWWAPPGCRAAWVRCPDGTGFHTAPAHEVVESVDGELVWTPIGWSGSVWLRVGTGVPATIDDGRCAACGRTGPRVVPTVPPAWMGVVDSAPDVAAWLGVRRVDGSLALLVVPVDDAPPGWRRELAAATGLKVVPVSADRYGRVGGLAGGASVVDEAVVADALRKAVPS